MNSYNGFKKLEDNIGQIIKPISRKKKDNFFIVNNLAKNWQNIVGEQYSKFCKPQKVNFNHDKKAILTISASNSAVAFALESKSQDIIEKIAIYFGYKLVSSIKITQTLREAEKSTTNSTKDLKILSNEDENLILQLTQEVKDKNLQEILQKLGKSIFSKKLS